VSGKEAKGVTSIHTLAIISRLRMARGNDTLSLMTKRSRILLATGFLAAFTLFAVTEAELATAMKATQKSMGALKKGGKTGPDAEAAAMTIQSSMTAGAAFFKEHHMAEAEEWSTKAAKSAGELAAAAKANDEAAATAAFGGVASSCKTCHTGYREQTAEGGYKVKMTH